MRTPKRRRPVLRARGVPPAGCDLETLARSATYEPSAEHKGTNHPFGVNPRLRTDATECPRDLDPAAVQQWLRNAIANGDVGGIWAPDTYPQLAWYRSDTHVFEARVSNRDLGWYHGYPITAAEAPEWLP